MTKTESVGSGEGKVSRQRFLLRLGIENVPALVPSFILAELFFKFHSFTLEFLAFLAVWQSLAWLTRRALTIRQSTRRPVADEA